MAVKKTPARLWREGYVSDYQEALARVRTGAALLDDAIGPGWEDRIDPDKLDILSSSRCILGQLNWFESLPPERWWQFFKPTTLVAGGFSCGFVLEMIALLFRPSRMVESYGLLTRAWKTILTQRRFQRLKTMLQSGPVASSASCGLPEPARPQISTAAPPGSAPRRGLKPPCPIGL